MQFNTSFYLLQIILQILGVIFAIRISSLKKDAWIFYLLATLAGSFQFFNFNNFNISNYINNLAPYCHDLLLPLCAILIYGKYHIQPRKITKQNLSNVTNIILIVSLLMILFTYMTSPMPQTLEFLIIDIFGILVYVGSALLAFGYIAGLLINAIYSLEAIIMNISFASESHYSALIIINIIFAFIGFVVFLTGYIKNRKLLSE